MTRIKDYRKAINLRKQGKTYSQIKQRLDIPKSTLSGWLGEYTLTKKQLTNLKKNIKKNRFLAIEKCRITKRKKREARLKKTYQKEKNKLLPLSQKELFLSGLFLYWGEGVKSLKASLSLNNTDPRVMKFYLYWLIEALRIPKDKIKVNLHLYRDMNTKRELNYWSKELKIPLDQFTKPYIKKSKKTDIDHKGFGHGTCGLLINKVRLKEKIMMGIEAIADHYAEKVQFIRYNNQSKNGGQ